jgi:hypothetical protein
MKSRDKNKKFRVIFSWQKNCKKASIKVILRNGNKSQVFSLSCRFFASSIFNADLLVRFLTLVQNSLFRSSSTFKALEKPNSQKLISFTYLGLIIQYSWSVHISRHLNTPKLLISKDDPKRNSYTTTNFVPINLSY